MQVGDVTITLRTHFDGTEPPKDELVVDNEVIAEGAPLSAAAVLDALRLRKGLLDGCIIQFEGKGPGAT